MNVACIVEHHGSEAGGGQKRLTVELPGDVLSGKVNWFIFPNVAGPAVGFYAIRFFLNFATKGLGGITRQLIKGGRKMSNSRYRYNWGPLLIVAAASCANAAPQPGVQVGAISTIEQANAQDNRARAVTANPTEIRKETFGAPQIRSALQIDKVEQYSGSISYIRIQNAVKKWLPDVNEMPAAAVRQLVTEGGTTASLSRRRIEFFDREVFSTGSLLVSATYVSDTDAQNSNNQLDLLDLGRQLRKLKSDVFYSVDIPPFVLEEKTFFDLDKKFIKVDKHGTVYQGNKNDRDL